MDASVLLADPLSENMAVFCCEDGGSNCTNQMVPHSMQPVSPYVLLFFSAGQDQQL